MKIKTQVEKQKESKTKTESDWTPFLFWLHSTKMQLNKSRQRRVWNQGVSLVWNHHVVMYVINPKQKYTLTRDAMPSLCDGFHTPCG